MLKNENIICISWLVWDSIPLVMHHMMTRLSINNRILFVDPPIAYSNLAISPSMSRGHFRKTLKWLQGVRKVAENLHVYYPPPMLLQYGHLKIVDYLNQWITVKAIKKTADRLGFTDPILWIYHPYAINLNYRFNSKLVCYDCNDDVGFFFSNHFDKRARLSQMESELTKKADIIFTTSKYLYDLRRLQNINTHYFPSGLDLKIFREALSADYKFAPELGDISAPIIGFVGGMVNLKMNWEWIREAAASRPQWNFVFVGPCVDLPPSDITDRKNIFFLGSKPQESIPAYIKGFDVCLIPYRGEEFLKSAQPTKAFEYLAIGKPVVASWINELENYREVVRLSRGIKDFIENIEAALEDGKDEEMIKKYIRTAQGYTWDERIEGTSSVIMSFLENR